MPRWASRITLEVDEVRIERVQMISEKDAIAEGIVKYECGFGLPHWTQRDLMPTARAAFLKLFYGINKRAPATENPWIYSIKFIVVK